MLLDFAACSTSRVAVFYLQAGRITLILNQLTTHSSASLCADFPPTEARRISDNLDLRHTPEHGSWLTMAELDLAVLQHQRVTQPHRFAGRGPRRRCSG